MAFYILYSVDFGSNDVYSGRTEIEVVSRARPLLDYWYHDYTDKEILDAIENDEIAEFLLIEIDKPYPKEEPDTEQLLSYVKEWEVE